MDPQSVDGIHRLELPVSRTTLNSWGGVPIEMSEKSSEVSLCLLVIGSERLTLCVEEVADSDWVTALWVV